MLLGILIFGGGIALVGVLMGSDTVMEVEAAKAPTPDADGYIWVDNKDPDPKVDFNWIDATKGTHLNKIEFTCPYSGHSYFQEYNLPFNFDFYGKFYSKVWVLGNGNIYFESAPGYNTYQWSQIPNTGIPNGFIGGWNDYYMGASPRNCYGSRSGPDFKVYALQGETYGERWVAFEWYKAEVKYYYCSGAPQNSNPDKYLVTMQVILYESGLIKLQYLETAWDATFNWCKYAGGENANVGIESPDGRTGVSYSFRQKALTPGLAVMFGKRFAIMNEVYVEKEDNGAMYAQHKSYLLRARVQHPIDSKMIKVAEVTYGLGLARAVVQINNDGTFMFYEVDPMGVIQLDVHRSRIYYVEKELIVEFRCTPTFQYPTRSFQPLSLNIMGVGILPTGLTYPDSYWVETQLDLVGSLAAMSENRGMIQNGGWVYGGEVFHFEGLRTVYPGTSLSPMPGTYSVSAIDERGTMWTQENVEGNIKVRVVAENDLVRKTFNLTITGVPPSSDISELTPYQLGVDPFLPTPPTDVRVRADSFDDPNYLFDDDTEVYVTWYPSQDFESGVAGYHISTLDPTEFGYDIETIFVAHPGVSAKIDLDGYGTKRVYVWAVDRAGNPSLPSLGLIRIDRTEVTFSEFSPGDSVWINTNTPVCSVLISDGDGSGVSARDVEYSTSTGGVNSYGPWFRVTGVRDGPQVRASVKASFNDGKDNFIRFRAKDLAGNGWTHSSDYNVWVDIYGVLFQNFQPFEADYQGSSQVVVSIDITDVHGGRPGSGVIASTIEYRMSTGGVGLFGEWMPVTMMQVRDELITVAMELQFREGDQNYVQYRAVDGVGNYVASRAFNVKVNSAPIVVASISDPMNGHTYITSEMILFDATRTSDPDGDVLEYEWYSDIAGFLSSDRSFYRSLPKGDHVITLIVNDPAHAVVGTFELTVLEFSQIDQDSIDSDGDGIPDWWEIAYGLDPFKRDSHLDVDFDTFTNLQEYLAGTDPTNRNSHPPYPIQEVKDIESDEGSKQFMLLTLAVVLVSILVIIGLVSLALSKRGNFLSEVEDEKAMEEEEMSYRNSMRTNRK